MYEINTFSHSKYINNSPLRSFDLSTKRVAVTRARAHRLHEILDIDGDRPVVLGPIYHTGLPLPSPSFWN